MPFSYYRRLSARQRRIYDRSDAVVRVELPHAARLCPEVDALDAALRSGDRRSTEAAADKLSAAILGALNVPGVRVRVLAKRPSHDWGELHGLYEPEEGKRPLITVWMRTAQRKQVVAFKTFLRTLLHEINHHLDYELLDLDDSYHTQGFYKRESSLFHQLVPDPLRYDSRARVKKATTDGAARGLEAGARTTVKAAVKTGRTSTRAPRPEQTKLPFAE